VNAKKLFEKSASDLKDGGFIFQALISHNLSFDIKEGYVVLSAGTSYPFDKSRINAKLHQVDLFPDLKTDSGTATLTYVILSEVNNLARKFELAAEVIKRDLINPSAEIEKSNIDPNVDPTTEEQPSVDPEEENKSRQISSAEEKPKVEIIYPKAKPQLTTSKINIEIGNKASSTQGVAGGAANLPGGKTPPALTGPNALPPANEKLQEAKTQKVTIFYRDEIKRLEEAGRLTRNEIKRLNSIFFKNTSYKVTLSTEKIYLREVSTSSLDSGSPEIILKISTSLVDEAFGGKVPSFENFKLVVSGSSSVTVKGAEVANFEIFDPIEKKNDKIFQTILPSLILKFKSDQVPIETFTNKSSEVAANQGISYRDIFEFGAQELSDLGLDDFEEESDEEENTNSEKSTNNPNKKQGIEAQIKNLTARVKKAEEELTSATNDRKKMEAQYKLDELKKKLERAKQAYDNLGESLYVKQELALLEKELTAFYQQFDSIFESKIYSRRKF
jgi:hypothetical protein